MRAKYTTVGSAGTAMGLAVCAGVGSGAELAFGLGDGVVALSHATTVTPIRAAARMRKLRTIVDGSLQLRSR
jgi:hypothetical protein